MIGKLAALRNMRAQSALTSSSRGNMAGYMGGRSAYVQMNTSGYGVGGGARSSPLGEIRRPPQMFQSSSMPNVIMSDYTKQSFHGLRRDGELADLI